MRIAMAQMAMGDSIAENLHKAIEYIKECKGKADLLFFPELQLTPFYPLHKIEHWQKSREELAFTFDSPEVKALRNAAKEVGIWISPNLYMDDSFTNPLSGITYPEGEVIFKADDTEQLIIREIELSEVKRVRNKRPYILTRREDSMYCIKSMS